MKRLQLARRHFAYFRQHNWWIVLWLYVWIFQIVYALSYWGGADVREVREVTDLSRITSAIVLLTVFVSGNLYSVQNNTFLKTRPLPPSTCFLTDCLLPFCLYMIMPLLQEVPVVIWWNFEMTDLLWAWLDLLVIHGLAFSAVWLLGALIPRLSSPLKWAGMVIGICVAFWLSSALMGEVGETMGRLSDFSDLRFANTEWYFTNAGILLLIGCLCLIALKYRFRARTRVAFLYFVVVPLSVFCFQRSEEIVPEMIAQADLHRPCANAREMGYGLKCLSYRQRRRSYRRSYRSNEIRRYIRYEFNIINHKEFDKRILTKQIMRSTVHAASETRELQTRECRQSGGGGKMAMYSLLFRYYGGDDLLSEPPNQSNRTTVQNNQHLEFGAEKLDGLRDQLLKMEHDLRIWEYELVPLMSAVRPGKPYFSQRAGALRVTRPRRDLQTHRSKGYNENDVDIKADVTLRQENLMWKRLIIGKPPARILAVVFRERNGSGIELACENVEAWTYRYGGAFPTKHENVYNSFSYDVTASGESEEPDGDTGRRQDLVVDMFEMRPVRKVRAKVADWVRFGIGGDVYPPDRDDIMEFAWNNPLEVLRRIGKGHVPDDMDRGGWERLMEGLGRYPPERYKKLLFDAARYRPVLASLIVANSWGKEAMDIWLELIRRRRKLPVAVLRTLFMVGDRCMKKALVKYQRYYPTPNILSASRLKEEWKEPVRRATEQGVDFWYHRIAPYEERGYFLREVCPMVALSGEWIDHLGLSEIRKEIRRKWSRERSWENYFRIPNITKEGQGQAP